MATIEKWWQPLICVEGLSHSPVHIRSTSQSIKLALYFAFFTQSMNAGIAMPNPEYVNTNTVASAKTH